MEQPGYRLDAIYLYPVKSLGAIALSEARLERRGLQHDRRWMLVDDEGLFISQREHPALARLGTAIEREHLIIFEKQRPAHRLALPLTPAAEAMPQQMVQVWGDRCRACVYGPEVNDWFCEFLGRRVRLVFMPNSTLRRADGRYAPAHTPVSFADGFPYLIIGQASLDDLNQRLR